MTSKHLKPNFITPSAIMALDLACVASVSVWFRSKEIPRKGTFGFDRARNETRAKKRSLTSLNLVPRSFRLNRTLKSLGTVHFLRGRRGLMGFEGQLL